MSYIEQLTAEVNELFNGAADRDTLRQSVVEFVTAKSKESFKNGLSAARKRSYGKNGQTADQAK